MSEHVSNNEKKLILADALSQYRADQIEVTDETHTLEDGHMARLVNVYYQSEDDYGCIDRLLCEDECYYAAVVGGTVYSNVELDALVWEYTTVTPAAQVKVA